MVLFWIGLGIFLSLPLIILGWLVGMYVYLCIKYIPQVMRIFAEKPLFVIPRGQPLPDAEQVRFPTSDGLLLFGCYLRTRRTENGAGRRKGVILFGLEFGSTCWSCWSYCEHLVEAGFDVFAFESRNQGSSDVQKSYEPLQWVTDYEVRDTEAALAYLKGRPDADARGVGLFGISKGAGAGLVAASRDLYVRCCVTDGVFATYTTLVPYMRSWFRIYNNHYNLQTLLPSWYYGLIGRVALRRTERTRHCHFPFLEKALPALAPRPLLMIHGGDDTYIKPDMAEALFRQAREPKELWLVEKAKHNQALQVAGADYRRRVLEFFERHLALLPEPAAERPVAEPTDAPPGQVEECRNATEPRRADRAAGNLASAS